MKEDKKISAENSSCWDTDSDSGGRREKGGGFFARLSDKLLKTDTPQSANTKEEHGAGKRLTENCMVCGEKLQYHEKATDLRCTYCRKTDSGNIVCPKGHYVCEQCHNRDAMRVIRDIMLTTESKNPLAIAELAFTFPGLPMLGCPHAYIAGGALMAALKNSGTVTKNSGTVTTGGFKGISNEEVEEVFRRTRKQAHGGYCGLTGVCGIAPALGACVSIITGSKCGKDKEQRLTMEAVSRVTRAITDLTGPSCCKAYTRVSLALMIDFFRENFGIDLPQEANPDCRYMNKHPHGCRQNKCPYFPG